MVVVMNLDGKQMGESDFKKILVSDDVHEGTIKDFVVLDGQDLDTGAIVKKIVLNVELPEGTVSSWMNTKITKAQGNFSSSNLYVLLEKAKLLEDIAQYQDSIVKSEESEQRLTTYLNEKLGKKKIKVLTKTVKPKTEGDPYSKIDKVISIE